MHSSIVSKIEKARSYSVERDRVSITALHANFRGNHDTHQVSYEGGNWRCSCSFSASHSMCSHTMAFQRMLEGMVLEGAKPASL